MRLRKRAFPKSSIPFADVHMALFAAATRNQAALEERLAVIEKRLADGKLPAGPVVPRLFRAMTAFAGEDHAGCVAQLEPVLDEVVRIGGSHAQRELIEDTFIVALMKSGDLARARRDARPPPAPPALAARHKVAGNGCTARVRLIPRRRVANLFWSARNKSRPR